MDKQANGKRQKNAGGDLFSSMNDIMLVLAEHLMEYVSILKQTEGRPSLGAKQKG